MIRLFASLKKKMHWTLVTVSDDTNLLISLEVLFLTRFGTFLCIKEQMIICWCTLIYCTHMSEHSAG